MGELSAHLQCRRSGPGFLRLDCSHRCYSFASKCAISSDQAIRVHRFPERIEWVQRVSGSVQSVEISSPTMEG